MTTVRGMIRSTNTITADGLADDQSTARARAVDSLESTGYDVVQTNTLSSTAAGTSPSALSRGRPRSSRTRRPGRTTTPPWPRTRSRSPAGGSASASLSTPDGARDETT